MKIVISFILSLSSQVYLFLVIFISIPFYISILGKEAYGLIGFFSTLQVLITVADVGLSTTISRQTAMFNEGAIKKSEYYFLLKIVEIFFLVISAVFALLVFLNAAFLANDWLNLDLIESETAIVAIKYMSISIGIRWFASFNKSLLIGNQKIIWLSTFNSVFATFRYLIVIPIIYLSQNPILAFFKYQLIIAVVEWLVIFLHARKYMPSSDGIKLKISLKPLENVYRFSLAVSITGIIWIALTQLDKLLVSSLVSLSDYGIFAVSVQAASIMMIFSGPISNIMIPRLTAMEVNGDHDGFIKLYINMSQILSVIIFPLATMIAFQSKSLLLIWTNDIATAERGAPILSLYILGNALMVISAFPYYVQCAKGILKYHLWVNIVFVLLMIPSLFYLVNVFGAKGAGITWLGFNVLVLLFWVPVAHRIFVPTLTFSWLLKGTIPIVIIAVLFSYFFSLFISFQENELLYILKCIFSGLASVFFASISTKHVRLILYRQYMRLLRN